MGTAWKQLIKALLIGTNRTALRLQELDTPFDVQSNQASELQLLELLTQGAMVKKAAVKHTVFSNPLPKVSPPNKLSKLAPSAVNDLQRMTKGYFDSALPEWLSAIRQGGYGVPVHLLPEVFDLAEKRKEIRGLVEESMDERGKWLASQNPKWQFLLKPTIEKIWELGSPEERLNYLQRVRLNNPETALNLLQSTWKEEAVKDKKRFLKALQTGLNHSDEAFLESCLDAGRKEVRKIASSLLALLPKSKLSQRMLQRSLACLEVKKRFAGKSKVIVNLPELVDEAMIRDGVDPSVKWFKGGVKASRLGQMMSLVHPSEWCRQYRLSEREVLSLFVRSDWSELLLQTVFEASAFHKDPVWLKEVAFFWLKHQDKDRWKSLNVAAVLEALPAKEFNEVVLKTLSTGLEILPDAHPVTSLLKTTSHPWSKELTLKLIGSFCQWMRKETSKYWNGWHYRSILKNGAYCIPPEMHDKLNHLWPRNARIWGNWENEVNEFSNTLTFRYHMLKHIKESKKQN